MNIPVIQSVGPPPEKHAVRVVNNMMRWLWLEHERVWRSLIIPSIRTGRSRLGSPKAQIKFGRKILDSGKDVIIDCHVFPGKRANWSMALFDWMVATPDGDPYETCPPEGESVSLIMTRTDFISQRGRPQEPDNRVILIISFHAAVRAAERAGVRTPQDLIRIMKEIAIAIREFGKAINDADLKRTCPPEGWRIPFASGTAVVGEHRDHMTFIVKTIL